MRVLHVNAGNMYGGVETFLVTLARQARLCPDMQSSFGFCFAGRFSEELGAAGAPTYPLGAVRTSRFWTIWESRQELRRILQRIPFDIVICHMPWNLVVFGPEARRAEKPLVFWAHSPATGHGWLEFWARRTRPDLAIANSRFTAGSMPRLFPDVRSRVIYIPVAIPEIRTTDALAVRQKFGVSRDTVVIVQVSRMEAWKGHMLHLQALARLRDLPGWVCWMVGGAQRDAELKYLSHLNRETVRLGIANRVRFLGQRPDVPQILAAADIFCQPNEAPEPFGIVFIEALGAGLPVVTTRIGGTAEIITHAECLVPPGNPDALAEQLRRLINSPEHLRAIGRSGPERAKSLCDPAKQINELHRTLIGLTGAVSAPVMS